jgi:hypothetical protein
MRDLTDYLFSWTDSISGIYVHNTCTTYCAFNMVTQQGLTLEDGKLVPFCPVCERPDYERRTGYADGLGEALRMITAKQEEIRHDDRDCACVLEGIANELSDLMK